MKIKSLENDVIFQVVFPIRYIHFYKYLLPKQKNILSRNRKIKTVLPDPDLHSSASMVNVTLSKYGS